MIHKPEGQKRLSDLSIPGMGAMHSDHSYRKASIGSSREARQAG